MELRHLRYFVAVAQEENVTRAAARLHISQPPLTRQIHDLEEELRVSLFQRTGKTIRLTKAGTAFLKEAKQILHSVDVAIESVRDIAAEKTDLHVGYAPSPTVEILPNLLARVEQTCPNVNLILHDSSSPEMLSGLRNGRLQAAIMMQPSKRPARGLSYVKLRSYRVGVAMHPRHTLATKRAVTISQLENEPLVIYSHSEIPDYFYFLKQALGPAASKMKIAHESDSGPSLVAAVESRKGICVTGEFLMRGVGHRLRFIPIQPPPPPANIVLAYIERRDKDCSVAIQQLVAAAQSEAASSR